MSDGKPKSRAVQHGATGRNFSRDPVIERFLKSRNDLSERQRNAVELLLHGLSDQEVAAQIGVDRTTIFRWQQSVAFQRELARQRRTLWEQSAGEIQSMVKPALSILRAQLTSGDPKLAMRAAAVLLRFATPSRLVPASPHHGPGAAAAADPNKQYVDDLIAYCEAPLPGEPGAPEDMADDLEDEEDEQKD